MRRILSRPKPDTMLELTCYDGVREHYESCYTLRVYDIGGEPLDAGVLLGEPNQYDFSTLGSLVEVLCAYGHLASDAIVRHAASGQE